MQSTRRTSSMTSSSSSHVYHHAKFRWTENLTCRFIQLRKEHGNMFTGRKYSAQAGWEYILRQMREEFPSIMADVHYRVLKKKWSNLLQQYKELKNPVHGDKNKADDISWPFYAAIDEVLGGTSASPSEPARHQVSDDEEDDEEEELNPQEFLCVSVDNDEDEDDASVNLYPGSTSKVPGLEPLRRGHVFDIERTPRTAARRSSSSKANKRAASDLLSRLPRATELTIRPIRRSSSELPPLEPIATVAANGRSSRKRGRTAVDERDDEEPSRESKLERKIGEFFEYTKKRDEENRNILLRMLEAVEDIRNAVR